MKGNQFQGRLVRDLCSIRCAASEDEAWDKLGKIDFRVFTVDGKAPQKHIAVQVTLRWNALEKIGTFIRLVIPEPTSTYIYTEIDGRLNTMEVARFLKVLFLSLMERPNPPSLLWVKVSNPYDHVKGYTIFEGLDAIRSKLKELWSKEAQKIGKQIETGWISQISREGVQIKDSRAPKRRFWAPWDSCAPDLQETLSHYRSARASVPSIPSERIYVHFDRVADHRGRTLPRASLVTSVEERQLYGQVTELLPNLVRIRDHQDQEYVARLSDATVDVIRLPLRGRLVDGPYVRFTPTRRTGEAVNVQLVQSHQQLLSCLG